MKLTHEIPINENKVIGKVTVAALGNNTIDADTELDQLHNFVRIIEYSQIDFKANMKLVNGIPVVTSDPTDGSTIEEITIKDLINKKIILDENFSAELPIEVEKITPAEYKSNVVFNSPELIAQAYAVLFISKIESAVAEKLAEIRALASDIEKPVDVVP